MRIPFEITIDALSTLMILIINGVGMLIHIYSIGYMKDDEGANKFFSYLNLFVFFMLILVLSSNYLMLFIGWEGVGLCSYLLIGFWFQDHANNNAAKKAFIINRIGDVGFLVGLFFLFSTFNTLNIKDILQQASLITSGTPVLFLITICLFIGATGKSAQLPLFTWLPDAMAGPTPVSALIHAATMVTAGIYLIARSSILFILSPITLNIILIIGTTTALIAGLIAIYQSDIKKILAYSTVSQLGFLFMAIGFGSFDGAMFHMFTHAFFKALLFLGAGSVIHALDNEQNINNMGGLSKKIPFTFAVFLIGTIAISGIPPFAGFFSKELILGEAYHHSLFMGLITTLVSLLTTLYMFRLLFVVFIREASESVKQNYHIHESPNTMLIPMYVLAVLSIIAGFLNVPKLFSSNQYFETYLHPVFAEAFQLKHHLIENHESITFEWIIMIVPLLIIGSLIYFSYFRFVKLKQDTTQYRGINKIFANKLYIDELYYTLITKPLNHISEFFREIIDQNVINQFINWIGKFTLIIGNKIRMIQTGNAGYYMLIMVLFIISMLFYNIIL
jgi:NADH-quinone oxidoreductase subunit L